MGQLLIQGLLPYVEKQGFVTSTIKATEVLQKLQSHRGKIKLP
jgi:hypothetical protein